MKRKYTWRPDHTDPRDHLYAPVMGAARPDRVDLRPSMPAPFDQGQLGSCTANAWAGALAFIHSGFMASRLMVYYGEREIEGTIKQDAGANIRDGAKFLHKSGVCPEAMWPYMVSKFKQRPPAADWTPAATTRISNYKRILYLNGILDCLASGFPVVFGFTVYESFEGAAVARSGVLQMPKAGEQTVGGHAVLAVGYDQPSARLIVRNSWGASWGQAGHFTMPYAYIDAPGLADDFWTVRA